MAHLVAAQDRVFAFLADQLGRDAHPVRRIDTHAAVVFLAGERALKIKRAVRYPFLDYSTLARRKAACAAEIEVNRTFAPAIYRGVIAITREADGRLAIGGAGEAVEWAVDMRRFDESLTLDLVAERGGIDRDIAAALARALAAAHDQAPRADAGGWIAALGRFIDQNEAAFGDSADLFPPPDIGRLSQASRTALASVRPLLSARGERGRIRRGHGDLHLGNIALIDGVPVPFDAIEFDPVIASGDVLYDLAFLLMDLVERGLGPAANAVLNRYLIAAGRDDDLDALAALPLFLSVRAAIRAKVTAARREFAPAADHARVAEAARAYFRLAGDLIAPPAPTLVALGGLSGTGKSVLARDLAPALPPAPGAVVLRSDIERKRLFGVAETERLPVEAYSPEVTARIYERLADQAVRALRAGHSAVVDAVFARPDERARIEAAGRDCGVACRGLFLTAPLATRLARVGGRAGDASDANAGVARAQEAYDLGTLAWTRIDAAGTPAATLAAAGAALAAGAPAGHAPDRHRHGETAECIGGPSRP